MRYASVCDGIGAVHVAWKPLGWECAWTSEVEPFPAAVVDHHWRLKNLGDMTKLTEEMLNDCGPIDLLVGGTPCQSFSVAGLRRGLDDPRGNLALRFTQLVGVMRPTWVVWENVPGVLSSAGGRDFGTFLGALGELGYGFAYRVLDAQWFGVAQRRRRVFVVGYLGDWRRAAAVLFERESVFGNPPTRGKAWEGVARSTAASLTSSGRGVERCGESRGQDDVVLAAPQVANPLTARMGKGINTTCDEGQTPIVSFDWQKGNDKNNPRPSTMNIVEESTPTIGNTRVPAVAFTKSKRAQSVTDDETWVPGEVSPTMSCFDQGDTRATTVVAIQERAICENPDAGPDGVGVRADGVSYTLEARTVPQAVAFKPSHYTRGKDGAPSEVAAPLSADADKGDQDTVVAFAQNQLGEVRTNAEVMGTVNTNQNASGRNTPMVAYGCDDTAGTIRSNTRNNSDPITEAAMHVMHGMAVRRLTPRECERLQGFPDDYTLVTYRGKPAADGPRYRALGNSMAVPVMRWIGERIAEVDVTCPEEATDGR